MRLYKKYFVRYKIPFVIGIICVTLEAICDLLGPTLMSRIVNRGIQNGSNTAVLYWGGLMLLVTLIGAVFAVARNNLASFVSQKMGADLRVDLFSKILQFSEQSADQIESGSLITRMTNDTSQIVQFVNGLMRIFFKAPVTCIGSIILASMLNIRLSLIIYAVVFMVTLLIYFSMKLSYPRYAKLQTAVDQVNSRVQEYLIGVRLVKAFGTYQTEQDKFEACNQGLRQKGISSQMIITVISPILTLVVGMGTVAVLYAGSILFERNLANTGDITAFTIYMAQILSSLLMITNIFNTFVRTKASTHRIEEILDCEEDFKKTGETRRAMGAIEFSHVTFAYPKGSGVAAIRDLSFTVPPGSSLAIIGPTGSGKSTIAWLLLRFYDVDTGTIFLDGQDIKTLGIDQVRDNVAIVPQKPVLFSGSVADNMRWGNPKAGYRQIAKAIVQSEAGFVFSMKEKYNSQIGSGGVNLSGGQRQRLSIARGLLKEAPVLILDDATSALDAITEAKIRANLNRSTGKQTQIIITQRCGTAMSADRILVMNEGQSVGFGAHEELMQSCEVYRDIYSTQIESSKEG